MRVELSADRPPARPLADTGFVETVAAVVATEVANALHDDTPRFAATLPVG